MIHDSETRADNSHYGLRVGTYDWQHPHWQNTFYPADLPEDWLLDFYSNEFTAVVVPAQYWSQAADPEQLSDNVPSRFRFYLEYTDAVDHGYFVEQCSRLGPLLGGVIGADSISDDISCCFYPDIKTSSSPQLVHALNADSADIALIEIGDADLRQQRASLESLIMQSQDLTAVLVYDKKPAIDKLQSFKTLIELMGF